MAPARGEYPSFDLGRSPVRAVDGARQGIDQTVVTAVAVAAPQPPGLSAKSIRRRIADGTRLQDRAEVDQIGFADVDQLRPRCMPAA
jgi:hypothetical protein